MDQSKGKRPISITKIVFAVVGVVGGLVVGFQEPTELLSKEAMMCLGLFVWAVCFWIGGVFPEYLTGLIMITLYVILKVVPFSVAYSSYSHSVIWLMLSAMILGGAIGKTGLLKRITLNIMKVLPANFAGQSLAMLLAGTVMSPMIPTSTAKVAMASPFAAGISEELGYKPATKQSAGMFVAMYFGFAGMAPVFLSGTFLNYTGLGLVDPSVGAQFTWGYWLLATVIFGAILVAGGFFGIKAIYGPKNEETVSSEYVNEQLALLGKMKRDEIITASVTLLVLLLWIFERQHGISSGVVAIIAFILLGVFKVIDAKDVRALPWDTIIFMGAIMTLAAVFPMLKINKWMESFLGPLFEPLFSNMYLFVLVASIAYYLIRLVMVSQTTMLVLFVMLLQPFALEAGVSPWVLIFMAIACNNTWNVNYQNTQFIVAMAATQGKLGTFAQTVPGSILYMVLCTLGLVCSVPLWKMMGIMP